MSGPAPTLVGVIDPTSPAVVDVRDFRRTGAAKRITREVPLQPTIGNPVVRAGDVATVEALLESVIEGILVTGTVTFPISGECSRCLGPVTAEETAQFTELCFWDPPELVDPDDVEPTVVAGVLLDLGPLVHDAVGLELPLAPVCRPDCAGLCVECGARLDDDPGHSHDTPDPRWAALQTLLPDTESEPGK